MDKDHELASDKHYAIYISFGLIDCCISINLVSGMKFRYIKSLKRRRTECHDGSLARNPKEFNQYVDECTVLLTEGEKRKWNNQRGSEIYTHQLHGVVDLAKANTFLCGLQVIQCVLTIKCLMIPCDTFIEMVFLQLSTSFKRESS